MFEVIKKEKFNRRFFVIGGQLCGWLAIGAQEECGMNWEVREGCKVWQKALENELEMEVGKTLEKWPIEPLIGVWLVANCLKV